MAAHVINPNQLAMLMPARQLYDMHSLDSVGMGGDVERMRAKKRRDNARSGMTESIERHGVQKPVHVYHGQDPDWAPWMGDNQIALGNGNHRVVAAHDVNPNMEIPVENFDRIGPALDAMAEQDIPSLGGERGAGRYRV